MTPDLTPTLILVAVAFIFETATIVILAFMASGAAKEAREAKRLGEAAQRRISRLQARLKNAEG